MHEVVIMYIDCGREGLYIDRELVLEDDHISESDVLKKLTEMKIIAGGKYKVSPEVILNNVGQFRRDLPLAWQEQRKAPI